jgi:hypothetical protein
MTLGAGSQPVPLVLDVILPGYVGMHGMLL